jgi:hypothetical protein
MCKDGEGPVDVETGDSGGADNVVRKAASRPAPAEPLDTGRSMPTCLLAAMT